MTCNLWIENPPPFKQALRGDGNTLASVPMDEGEEIIKLFTQPNLDITGFHHADLDRFEYTGKALHRDIPLQRYDTFEYATFLKSRLNGLGDELTPHRVVVYQTPEEQHDAFKKLWKEEVRRVVLVGKPFSRAPGGAQYRSNVEEVLKYLASSTEFDFDLGVIGIHTRDGEANRITEKFIAAGKKLFVMGQFLDAAEPMLNFMDELAQAFDNKKLDLNALQWNVGLAIFGLKTRNFHAKLLRKKQLECENRFCDLRSTECRITQSLVLNLEFVEQVTRRAKEIGLNVGYSIQPIIERYADGRIHPSTYAAVTLARYISSSLS